MRQQQLRVITARWLRLSSTVQAKTIKIKILICTRVKRAKRERARARARGDRRTCGFAGADGRAWVDGRMGGWRCAKWPQYFNSSIFIKKLLRWLVLSWFFAGHAHLMMQLRVPPQAAYSVRFIEIKTKGAAWKFTERRNGVWHASPRLSLSLTPLLVPSWHS